jgi:hypothetical protein
VVGNKSDEEGSASGSDDDDIVDCIVGGGEARVAPSKNAGDAAEDRGGGGVGDLADLNDLSIATASLLKLRASRYSDVLHACIVVCCTLSIVFCGGFAHVCWH